MNIPVPVSTLPVPIDSLVLTKKIGEDFDDVFVMLKERWINPDYRSTVRPPPESQSGVDKVRHGEGRDNFPFFILSP